MSDERERGMEVRREVLGDEHVDRAIARTTRVHRRLPGSDHPLRLGRDLVAPRPRPPHAQRDHADRARRARPPRGARAAPARRAPQRPDRRTRSRRSCCRARSTAASRPPTRAFAIAQRVLDEERGGRHDAARSSSRRCARRRRATAAALGGRRGPTISRRSRSPRRSSGPGSTRPRSRTSGSAARTRRARTTATSRAWPRCSPGCRSRWPA